MSNYKEGKTLVKKYCIDCGKGLSCLAFYYGYNRCSSCGQIERLKKLSRHFNYKNGNYIRSGFNYCIDNCGKRVSRKGNRCKSCAKKGERHGMFRKGYLLKGSSNGAWRGGRSFEEYGTEFDSSLKEQVRFRDKYKCKVCGCSQLENGKQLDIHHIDYDKKNNNINNLMALCVRCHTKTNFNRKYWTKFFNA